MRSKAILSVLICLALLLSFGIAVKEAKADAILFPWIVKSSTVSTLVSVVNTAQGNPDVENVLHYQYWYKKTTANAQTEKCDGSSFKMPTSKDDIVTFDAAGNINSGKALFNDPTGYGNGSFNLFAAAPRRAFLIVDNNTPAFVGETNDDGTLYGEAMLLELQSGAAWGYIAFNSSDGCASGQNSAVSFKDGTDLLGEVIGDTETTQTVLLPPDLITTVFFVTPVDANQRNGTINAKVQLCYDPDQKGGCNIGGIWDNDEQPIDFDKKKNIVCTTGDSLSAFIPEDALARWKSRGGQGWTYIVTHKGSMETVDPAGIPYIMVGDVVIGKLEYTTTGVTIDGKAIPGTFNNFNWLRDNESLLGQHGINYIHNEYWD